MHLRLGFLTGFTIAMLNTALVSLAAAGPYAPPAGQSGSDAVAAATPTAWATKVVSLTRGPQNIANLGLGLASFGAETSALGAANATTGNGTPVVSLGDGGQITVGFQWAITNGPGADFAVFENGVTDTFLELGFVEVSSNGVDYFRFDSVSLTPTDTQVGSFGALDATNLHNLAGKYRAGFGTPFDLAELAGVSPLLDISHVRYVRIVDVIGSIDPAYATLDSQGNKVNDPWPTAFASGGFDLDAVGVLNQVPEPSSLVLAATALASGLAAALGRRRANRRTRRQ
ncbi:MAG: PEP-CTERM sorting domain-containing protein [Pirellulales bacterium]